MVSHVRVRTLLVLGVLVATLLLAPSKTSLANPDQAYAPEWWQTQPPAQPGFPVNVPGAQFVWGSSPTLADLDGNETLEIIIAGWDLGSGSGCGGMVYAYRHNGTLIWQRPVRAPVTSTPTTADLTGDGYPDVIIGMGGLVSDNQCWHGGVIALDGLTGQELWTFDTQDWLNIKPDGWRDGVFSTPAIADVTGDGQLEIVFGSWDECIYLLDRFGQPLWGNLPGILPQTYCGGHGFYTEDVVWSSPALADLTGDGRQEIIVGSDVSPGNLYGDPGGGEVWVLDADGNILAREWMDQVIHSSPAVADFDKDGTFEFVVGTGTTWENKGYYVTAFEYDPSEPSIHDRLVVKWRAPTAGRVHPSPSIADLNKDGWLDVVITVPIGEWGGDGTIVYAWHGRDGATLFQRRACSTDGGSSHTLSSPTIADIDGDSWPEILFSHRWEVVILNHDGTFYSDYSNPQSDLTPRHPACARDHTPTTDLTYWAIQTIYPAPAVGDLDNDGDSEIVTTGHSIDNRNQGVLIAWTGHPKDEKPPWPTWRHDEQHTGNAQSDVVPPANPTVLTSPSHTTGVWSTSNVVEMRWSGALDHESGIAGYSIVWDTLPTTLPDRTVDLGAAVETHASPPLPDGTGHYFHLRTADLAGNWADTALHFGPVWIDALPPRSWASSPSLTSGPIQVSWQGYDLGSGIASCTIQVRDNNGPWTTWLTDQVQTSAAYQGTVGHTYSFRSIARDNVGHPETAYTADGDTSTLVAGHVIAGRVRSLRGRPIANARVVATPSALNEGLSAPGGHFALGMHSSGSYDLSASHPGYGVLPSTFGVAVQGDLQDLDFYLPPKVNQITNGSFETSAGWEIGGTKIPTRVMDAVHSGHYALTFSAQSQASQASSDSGGSNPQESPTETGFISQATTLPVDVRELTLAWFYQVDGNPAAGDTFLVTIEGATETIDRSLPLEPTGWVHDWIDVTALAGQQVTVRFALTRTSTGDLLTVRLDEVALGPTTPFLFYLPLIGSQ